MKKILLSGAAFAVLGLAAAPAAHAADPVKLTVGGYVQEWFGYATNENGKNLGQVPYDLTTTQKPAQVASHTDAEIKFDGSTKLDSGITVAVEAAFNPSHEGAQDSGVNDNYASKRVFTTVSGAFGQVVAGQAENVAMLAHNDAPDEGNMYDSDGFWMSWVNIPTNNAEVWQQTTVQTNQPADKIAYTTPSFGGFQAAIDYTPNIDDFKYGNFEMPPAGSDQGTANSYGSGNATHYALTYGGTFGDYTVKADLGGMTQQFAGVQAYDAGLNIGWNGFTLGGSYIIRDTAGGNEVMGNVQGPKSYVGQKGSTFDIGLGYENGPWGVSGSYLHGAAQHSTGVGYDTDELWLAGLGYTMGPGIKLTESVFTVKYHTSDNTASDQNQGWAAVTGLNVTF